MERRTFLSGAALAGAGAALAAPVVAQERKIMTIVSTWPRDFPGLGISAQRLAAKITELSEGRLTTEYFAAGERVGAFDVFDEVAAGNSQAYIGSDYYFTGKHPAFAYFTTVPLGMTTQEWLSWIKYMGGQELWDELAGEFGLRTIGCGTTGLQAGGWFRKEVNSPDDFKGLKFRIPGLGNSLMSKLGASPVSVPGSQIYENLVSGAVDAAEWVGPYNDYFMKFYEAAKYYYTGGVHEPGGCVAFSMNRTFLDSLSDWEKAVIQTACDQEVIDSQSECMALNGEYLQKMVDNHGVEVRAFNEDIWDAFGVAAEEMFADVRAHSDFATRVDDEYQAALRILGGYQENFEYNYVRERNRLLDL